MRKTIVVGALSCALAVGASAHVENAMQSQFDSAKQSEPDFRLLVLKDRVVRWQVSDRGLPVRVSYAFLTKRATFAGARNCAKMTSPALALRPSRIADQDFRREVREAFALWADAANIEFVETRDLRTAGILIGAEAVSRGRAFTNVTDRGGTARVGNIQQSLICLNPSERWKIGFDGNLDVYDLRYTLAHEIGHAIGLDHPGAEGQLMSYRYVEKGRVLRPGDVAGVIALYGPRRSPAVITALADRVLPRHWAGPRSARSSRDFGIGDVEPSRKDIAR